MKEEGKIRRENKIEGMEAGEEEGGGWREGGFWAFKTGLCKEEMEERKNQRGRRMRRQFGLTSWTASSFHSIHSVCCSFSLILQSSFSEHHLEILDGWRSSYSTFFSLTHFIRWQGEERTRRKRESRIGRYFGYIHSSTNPKESKLWKGKKFKKTWSDPNPWSSLSCHFSPPQTTINLDFFHSLIIIKSHLTSPLLCSL